MWCSGSGGRRSGAGSVVVGRLAQRSASEVVRGGVVPQPGPAASGRVGSGPLHVRPRHCEPDVVAAVQIDAMDGRDGRRVPRGA